MERGNVTAVIVQSKEARIATNWIARLFIVLLSRGGSSFDETVLAFVLYMDLKAILTAVENNYGAFA